LLRYPVHDVTLGAARTFPLQLREEEAVVENKLAFIPPAIHPLSTPALFLLTFLPSLPVESLALEERPASNKETTGEEVPGAQFREDGQGKGPTATEQPEGEARPGYSCRSGRANKQASSRTSSLWQFGMFNENASGFSQCEWNMLTQGRRLSRPAWSRVIVF